MDRTKFGMFGGLALAVSSVLFSAYRLIDAPNEKSFPDNLERIEYERKHYYAPAALFGFGVSIFSLYANRREERERSFIDS